MKPIIGILIRSGVNEKNTPLEYIFDSTRRAIIKIGGEPLLLCPPQDIDYYLTKNKDFPDLTGSEKESIIYWIEQLDGLFIPGGDKITKYDYFVLKECLKRNIPIFGVCVGMQLISNYNVDNFELIEVPNKDVHFKEDKKSMAHKVFIEENSLLYKILNKKEILVNSFHQRMVKYTKECNITAKSEDGVIEAVELKNYDYCLGVQWHPELTLDDENSKILLNSFVEKARIHQKQEKDLKIKNIS